MAELKDVSRTGSEQEGSTEYNIVVNVPTGQDAQDLARAVLRAMEPADAMEDKQPGREERDYENVEEYEDLLEDIEAALSLRKKVSYAVAAGDAGDGVSLNWREVYLVDALLQRVRSHNAVREVLDNMHGELLGFYYDR